MNNLLSTLHFKYVEPQLPALFEQARLHSLTYDAFLRRVLLAEIDGRKQAAQQTRLRAAKLPQRKTLDTFDFSFQPTISERRLRELADLSFVQTNTNIVLLGPPGVGKSHVAIGLALAACRQGHKVRFYNVAGLINDLIKAQQEHQLSRVMAQITRNELIVLDELGFIPFTQTGAQLLFQFCSALYERVSVIITTNLRFADWGSIMGGDERMSAALLDRLTHRATILEFTGTSYRFRQQLQHQGQRMEAQREELPTQEEPLEAAAAIV